MSHISGQTEGDTEGGDGWECEKKKKKTSKNWRTLAESVHVQDGLTVCTGGGGGSEVRMVLK